MIPMFAAAAFLFLFLAWNWLLFGAINFCACAESSEHSFTGQTPEPDHNDNAATNEPCAASYCISLSNSMGNRALTTEEA